MNMTKPDRASALEAILSDQEVPFPEDEGQDWETLIRRINNQNVVPIVSNSVRNDLIFDDPSATDTNVDHIISKYWAARLGYPLSDKHRLERVANFNRVNRARDDEQAKINYLTFLKEVLLLWANRDKTKTSLVNSLKNRLSQMSFTDLADELELPKFASPEEDPLRILAKLPIKIFITTSYYDFLERALIAQNKPPQTQICFWSGIPANVSDEHRTDYRLKPTVNNPLVYHIHGYEKYPRSIVLSEDDHLDFLVEVSRDTDAINPIIPHYIKDALDSEALMMLGYRLHNWDFRTLFRGVVNARHSKLRLESIVLQLDPDHYTQGGQINPKEARDYLNKYFEPSSFRVIWQGFDSFIQELWAKYDQMRSV
jgi:hypothetical protein